MPDAVHTLVSYLEASALRRGESTAVVDLQGVEFTYAELNQRASRIAGFLVSRGVRGGDRVGVLLPKSADCVAILFGIMKAGAAYVPIDWTAPRERSRSILADCQVAAVFVDSRRTDVVSTGAASPPAVIIAGPDAAAAANSVPGSVALEQVLGFELVAADASPGPSDLAYILYTSGSTGIPKGVMLTHANATSFVDWCSSLFEPNEQDRFSSHAPFHFDLSVFDIYVCIKHGGTLFLISDDLGKNPMELARFIADRRLTFWYSTPSILTFLAEFGHLERLDCRSLRVVLFAGEVFPVKHLRELTRIWNWPAYFNLYGPTETNVCTYARIPLPVPDDRTQPYPIGWACSHCEPLVLDGDKEVAPGEEGLLYIAGASVFQGYWNRPAENAQAFRSIAGKRWYNTGDVVRLDPQQGYLYLGRRDRMVKRRGYRIELGEVESGLYRHPAIQAAAVVASTEPDAGTRIIAYLVPRPEQRPSIIELKTFCARNLPSYMVPDVFTFAAELPRTSTDKVDYQTLTRSAAAGRQG